MSSLVPTRDSVSSTPPPRPAAAPPFLSRLLAWLTPRRAGRGVVLAIAFLVITSWQSRFMAADAVIDPQWKVTASTGINREQQFFFFLYHLGLFPIATDAPIKADTKAEAQRQLREHPDKLKQDEGSTFRSGDRGRTYLYFVDAWKRHDSLNPSLRPAHHLAFVAALFSLFTAFWWARKTWHGALLVILLGSNPFQHFTIYKQENVFSWTITTMIFMLAVSAPLVFPMSASRQRWYPWFAAIMGGVFVGLVRNVRSEPTPLLLSAVLVLVTVAWLTKKKRALLVVTLAFSFWATSYVTRQFLDKKFQRAADAVTAVGGSAYTGPRYFYHEFWHVIWCGLGDFDTKKGYEWNDSNAFRYVVPRLQERHPEEKLRVYHWIERNYDAAGKYPVWITEIDGYHDIVREKITHDIKTDPKWFAEILWKRLNRVLDQTTPVGFAVAKESWFVSGRLVGWMYLPILALVVLARRFSYAKLMVFSVPLSIGPLFIYSDRGMSYYSCYHVFGVFMVVVLAAEAMRAWLKRRRTVG